MSLALCVLLCSATPAQNLVPNGSFEEYTVCPNNGGQIDRSVGWLYWQGSPEYFNRCSTFPYPSVPYNKIGYQEPHEGDAYAGVITYSDSDWFQPPELLREKVGHSLSEPLIPGIPVYISFWVSPGGFGSTVGTHLKWAANGIGVKFSVEPCEFPCYAVYASNDAVVQLETVLLDTAIWTHVSGIYTPDSAYEYLVIGNFMSDSLLTTAVLDPTGTYGVAYAFVDDICVSYTPSDCGLSSGISESTLRTFTVTNPFHDQLQIRLPRATAGALRARVLDTAGRILIDEALPAAGREFTLATDALQTGAYVLCLSDAEGEYKPAKVVRVE